jgi:hypothetical protein
MSSPVDYSKHLDPILKYAPPRVRDQAQPTQSEPSLPDATWPLDDEECPPDRRELQSHPTFSRDQAIRGLSAALALEPQRVPAPPEYHLDNRAVRIIVLRLCGAAGLAALGAWYLVLGPTATEFAREGFQATFLGTRTADNSDGQDPRSDAAAARRSEGTGLEPGSDQKAANEPKTQHRLATASAGLGATTISPAAPVIAPRPSSPVQSPAPAQSSAPAQPAAAVQPAAPVQPTVPALVIKQLDRDEVASMIKRGEDFIASGDVSSARLLLRRAAEAGVAQAALELGGTFDPNLVDKLGVKGLAADAAQARVWYRHAEQFGSAEATRRLQQLVASVDAKN